MKLVTVPILLFFSTHVFAGTWGLNSFENDTAQDWFIETSESEDPSKLILKAISAKPVYLDASTCETAIAASEVIVAKRTGMYELLPSENIDWVSNLDFQEKTILDKAEALLVTCMSSPDSELVTLFKESNAYYLWKEKVDDLIKRLK